MEILWLGKGAEPPYPLLKNCCCPSVLLFCSEAPWAWASPVMNSCDPMQQLQESTSRSTKGLRPFRGEGL
jgi:hypothetical protein